MKTKRADAALRRSVSTTMLTLYGIGNIVGAGVYVLVGKIAEPAGYLAVFAFILAALVAFCAALSYAELAARFPVSAGIAVYLHEAFRAKHLSTVIGLLLVLAGTISTATLLKGFSGYFVHFVPIDPRIVIVAAALLLLIVMLRGIKESVVMAAILTLIEVGGLLFLIAAILVTAPDALTIYSNHFSHAIGEINGTVLAGILAAALIAFYAFVGFEDMVNIAEEVQKPQRAYPRAILIAMACVTVLYIVVAAVALGVLTPQALSASSAPLADTYAAATGQSPTLIIGISLIATLNGVIVNVVMGSRFLYGLARRGWIPAWFSRVSGRHVPARGLIVVSIGAALCALLLPIERLAQVTSLLLLVVFVAVNVSLIVIRRRPTLHGPEIRISPHFVPWVGAIASILLLVGQVFLFLKD